MNKPSKTNPQKNQCHVTLNNSLQQETDPYAGSIPASEFMKQIRFIQQSHEEQDIILREAAQNYMTNLHCV